VASALATGVLLSITLLSACAPSSANLAAKQQARLDAELQTARTAYHVPPSLLDPITTREQQATVGAHGTSAQYSAAATAYSRLYQQVVALEHTSPQQAQALTQKDLNHCASVLGNVQSQGLIEAAPFAQQLQQEQQQFAGAKTTVEYFTLATQVEAEIAAVSAILPTYQQLSDLETRIQAQVQTESTGQPAPLQCAQELSAAFWYADPNVNVTTPSTAGQPSTALMAAFQSYAQWYTEDLSLFRAARTTADFSHLQALIAAQNAQLTSDQAQIAPQAVTQLLQTFQSDVSMYKQDGGTDQTYQRELTQDQQMANPQSLSASVTLEQTLEQQLSAFQIPLYKTKAQYDLAQLKSLLAEAQAKTTIDPANGQAYPDAYEYADSSTGIGDPEARLANAQTAQDYQDVDREILMFSTNLSALLKNLNDATPSDKPHQTDTQLMQYYGISADKVIVVSVREQEARFYDNGKLVQAYQVTTGAPDLPSPVGIHCVLEKLSHTTFVSPDPPGSPHYYQPTPINYALMYSYYGYFLHDAWWRTWFGKYSNLPHYDPAAFNDGSHGCINFALSNAAWMYSWADLGTPIIVY
jgi:lipoprotein-anchoring transpeptidase ErfK/SrfK